MILRRLFPLLLGPLLLAQVPAPLQTKEILRLLMSSQAVRLSTHPTCHGVGSSMTDKDMGDYLAGLLAEFVQEEGQNLISVATEDSERPDAWKCTVNFMRRNGEEHWAWGVSFMVRKWDRRVIPGSFRCIGAG